MRGEQGGNGNAKDRLLQASGLFAQSPYTEVGVAQILKLAGVQAPTLYHHFGDKEGLYVSWAIDAVGRLGLDISASRQAGNGRAGQLVELARCFADGRHPSLLQLAKDIEKLERPGSREAIMEAIQRAVSEPLYEVFLGAIEHGLIRKEPVQKVVAAFLHSSHATRPSAAFSVGSGDLDLEWVVERFLTGFSAR